VSQRQRGLHGAGVAFVLLLAAGLSASAAAQGRDPTRPPGAAAAERRPGAPGRTASLSAAVPSLPALHQILVVDGRRYAVAGSRLHAVGQLLGGHRIERIDDSGVVLRTAAGPRRLLLHTSVTVKPLPDPLPAAADRPLAAADPPVSTLAAAVRYPSPLSESTE
jgi:hypothetical protein